VWIKTAVDASNKSKTDMVLWKLIKVCWEALQWCNGRIDKSVLGSTAMEEFRYCKQINSNFKRKIIVTFNSFVVGITKERI
jgi:hypothetical protein